MPQNTTLRVEALTANQAQLSPQLMQARSLTTIPLHRIQHAILLAVDQNAPRFKANQAPLQDRKTYQANDGKHYYRPDFRIAKRGGQIPGPDVRFLKDADGNFRLHLELEEVPSTFSNAQPFSVHVDALTVTWNGNRKSFPQPTIFFDEAADGQESRIVIRAGMEIPANEIEPLYQAMQQQAKLELLLSYGYWLEAQPDEQPQEPRRHRAPPARPQAQPLPLRPMLNLHNSSIRRLSVNPALAQPNNSVLRLNNNLTVRPATVARLRQPVIPNISSELLERVETLEREQQNREAEQNYKKATIKRTIDFAFQASLKPNLPIYAVIRADEDSLRTDWTDTEFGFIRQAEFANTVYRLPDELRLAFNPELGTPHVIPQLYRDSEDNVRVRVTLQVLPYHDPAKLSALRDFLYRESAGSLAHPSVVVGGYEKAILRLKTAFPEEISLIAGDEISVSLESGIEMTLDLSLEYYRYLAELLTSPIGMTGEIEVTIPSGQDESNGLVKRIPMRLVLSELAGIELETRMVEETLSPCQVELFNPANSAVQIGACVPRLLQVDSNSVVPLAIFQAINKTAVPIVLEPAAKKVVEFEPIDVLDDVWNAVHLTLLDPQLTSNPTDVLDRIHEISPSGSLSWKIKVECPLFKAATIPDAFSELYRVVVEISREGYTPQQLVLGKDNSEGEVTMQRSLKEILGQDAANLPSFTYRVQNIYFDRQGAWSEAKSSQGNSLFIFPNREDG
ncbi:MAG: hypothetical protein AB4050_12360 [Synechococcus sp.]